MSDRPNATTSAAGELAVGIDLGTTKSVLAYVGADGQPAPLRAPDGGALAVPTAVFFGERLLVGDAAVEHGATTPEWYAEGFKREMGKPHFHRKIRQRGVPPEVLCAFVLRWLKARSQGELGGVEKAVITVPAYYNEPRRQATQEAGRLAGFEVIDILNEPTAAAIAYGHAARGQGICDTSRPRTVMVYDLGGGTFDVSLLRIEGGKFSTLATDGDIQLGGRDFDERLADFLADRFVAKHGVDPRSDAADMHRLWKVAQEAKHQLTERAKTTAVCSHAGLRMGVEVDRQTFEELIAPLVDRTLTTCVDVLQEARLDWPQIDEILLVGGSSRVPMVAERLAQTCGKQPTMPASPELLVARGAALHAALRSAPGRLGGQAFEIVNVNAHSLGIASVDPRSLEPINTILIPRNSALPCSAARKFVTRRDNQANVGATVLEGESENPKFCTPIGKCVVQLEPGLPAGSEVEVNCFYRPDGLIAIAARVPSTKNSAQVELRRDHIGVLEPLSVWELRLTSGEEPTTPSHSPIVIPEPPNVAVDSAATRDQLLVRLDFLYTQIGKRAAHIAVPAEMLPVQRTLQAAVRELSGVQQILDNLTNMTARITDRHERRQLAVLTARAKAHYQQGLSFAAHAYVALGRQCVETDHCPPGGEGFQKEAKQVRTALKSPG